MLFELVSGREEHQNRAPMEAAKVVRRFGHEVREVGNDGNHQPILRRDGQLLAIGSEEATRHLHALIT